MNDAVRSASRIYLDTNAIIYYVERKDQIEEKIKNLVVFAIRSDVPIYVSAIGVAECLYGAYRLNSEALKEKYNEIFYDIALFSLVPIDGPRAVAAAKTGAELGLKLIDAMHICAALESRCDLFVTNDRSIRSSRGLRVLQIKDL